MNYLSLFSGIEAATVAWHPLGWRAVAFAEIEPFPCAVLAHHYPGVPNLGDVTTITESRIAALGPIDIVVFGSPCQDLSVAGQRKGLKDDSGNITRSGLFFAAIDIIGWAREHCGCRFALWENVPGSFSSNKGRDFAAVVGALGGMEPPVVPPKGWGTEGVALGEKGLVEWSTLDAQWFGVAQRRRRVFALADFGDWANRRPVLLEPEGLRGDTAPSREAGQGVAPTIAGCANGGGANGPGRDVDSVESLQFGPAVSPALKARDYKGPSSDGDGDGAPLIAHALTGEGFDASEDGTGRGTPLVPVGVTLHGTDGTQSVASLTDLSSSLRARIPSGVENSTTTAVMQPVACLTPAMQVRRLTPVECERLQGFPDGYTNIAWRKQPTSPDGPRYKALGNSMAVPAMHWIGQQLERTR